ncbi:MAG: hypothetical protein NC311_06880 [Muribaculaceae bacterium]|nr:hypothetical protein [Muribaculaceae bacterium]MCM1398998.1 hypothetical protein [Clostridium sp.]MCM1458856.1 hypothetical protein [Bacteroides sp.]
MKLKSKIVNVMYNMAKETAVASVNSTCHFHFYQEKLNPKLDALKKYNEK